MNDHSLHEARERESATIDAELGDLLRSLPRVEASADFTERILESASSERLPANDRSWLRAAAVVVVICSGALMAGWMWSGRDGAGLQVAETEQPADLPAEEDRARGAVHPRVLQQLGGTSAIGDARLAADRLAGDRLAVDEVEQLRTRFHSLQQELEELRRMARSADPVVDLGSSAVGGSAEPVDYLLDLRALAAVKPEAVRTRY